jgi:hypothetical protein
VQLGYSRDGATVRIDPRWIDIPSDDYGGPSGAPSDAQIVGAIATVSVDLTKYDGAEIRKLTSFQPGGTAGTLPAFGTLVRQETKYATLLLDGSNEDWTFDQAFLRQAHEFNTGTRFSTYMLGWECWINNTSARVLFTYQ